MRASTPQYRHGRIIGAYLRTKKGGRELHPAAILTADSEIIQPERFDPRGGGRNLIVVIGITTKYALYRDPFVKLPFLPTGHPQTKLNKDAAAIIGWYEAVDIPDDCRFFAGDVPPALMTAINDKVKADVAKRIGREFTAISDILPLLLE